MTRRTIGFAMAALAIALMQSSCGGSAKPEEESGAHAEEAGHGHEHEEHEEGFVDIKGDAQKRAGIVVKRLQRGSLLANDQFVATVQPVDQKVAHIRPIARGRLTQVLANVGDQVKKGQRLAVYDNIEAGEVIAQLEAARAEAARVEVQRTLAHKQAERSKLLFDAGAIPARNLESAEAEAKALDEAERASRSVVRGLETRLSRFGAHPEGNVLHSDIVAPFSGVITASEAAVGEIADPSIITFSVADLSQVYVEAQVYERDLNRFRNGQSVQVTTDAFPGETFDGKVEAIKYILDPQTRTATVRCLVPNPKGLLKLEMYAQVSVRGDDGAVTMLPASAMQQVNGKQVVFRRVTPSRFEMREVAVKGSGPLVELVSGVNEEDEIVIEGAFQVKSVLLASELKSEHAHD